MCLSLKNESVNIQTAEEDIIVYKCLDCMMFRTIDQIKDGDEFTGVIRSIDCSGKIHKTEDGLIYFCTNNKFLAGRAISIKFGYKFSWVLDNLVQSVIVNGIELIDKIIIKKVNFKTSYRFYPVEIGETYTSELIKDEYDEVHVGLHSFVNLSSCNKITSDVKVKCIIPKGSHYYEGLFGVHESYASDKLTYVEVIED